VSPSTAPAAGQSAQLAASPVTGGREALVITVTLLPATGLPLTVPDGTPSQVAASVIDASRPWFQQVSHGLCAGYFPLTRGPFTVQTSEAICSQEWLDEISAQANAAVQAHESDSPQQTLDLTKMGAVVYYLGKVDACTNPHPRRPGRGRRMGGPGREPGVAERRGRPPPGHP
jgi:hypothetical protein